jgi:hypothetical protein
MATIIPYTNPIRIRDIRNNRIDYVDVLPRFDLMTQREDYQRGITAQKNYRADWLVNNTLELEIYTDSNITSISATIRTPDGSYAMNKIDITPSSWVSEPIIKLTYPITTEGVHSVSIVTNDGTYYLDEFIAKSGTQDKDLIEFVYKDSQNRYGGFFSGDNGEWNPKAYYTGIINEGDGETDQSLYTDDPGSQLLLETTESNGLIVTLTDIHNAYYKIIKQQRKCDNFFINGVQCTCLEVSKEDIDPNSDLVNITLRCVYTDNNGFFNYD